MMHITGSLFEVECSEQIVVDVADHFKHDITHSLLWADWDSVIRKVRKKKQEQK